MSNSTSNIVIAGNTKLSAKETFFKYVVYLPLFILCTAIAVTIAFLYIRYTVPYYKSYISILIKSERGASSRSSDSQIDEMFTGRRTANLANETEIIKSTSMMSRVVSSLGLNLMYYGEGKVKNSELYGYAPVRMEPVIVKDSSYSVSFTIEPGKKETVIKFEGGKRVLKDGDVVVASNGTYRFFFDKSAFVDGYKYHVHWLPVKTVAASLASALEVRQLSKEASILRISITTEVPSKGKDVLNQLIKEYDNANVEDRNRILDNTIHFIDDRMDFLTDELRKVENEMQRFKQNTSVVDLTKQGDLQFTEISKLQDNLVQQEAYIQLINMVKDYVSSPQRRFELVPSSLGITDATLSSLVSQYNTMQLERERGLKTMQPSHPDIKVLENQIEKLRLNIIENLENVKYSAAKTKSQLENRNALALSKLQSIPAKQREYLEITREQGIKEKLFVFLLQKREENAISRAAAVGNATAIDEAVIGWQPVSPNSQNIYRIAFAIGLLIPFGFIYLRDILNDKVVTRADLVKATSVPIIGEIAHHASMTRKFVVGMKDRSILAEQFRIIRTNLQFLLAHASTKNPVILVTSSIAGEGKTFTSMNLAAVWAVAGKKTVILELDLRKPKISKALALGRDLGITNYILGTAKKEELPQLSKDVPNLYIIGAGPIPPNPSEMIMDPKMDELFTYLRANFDVIIIDSAPIGLVSDSKILSKYADATLFVVRQRYTVKKQLSFIDDLYNQKALPSMGLLVNDVKIGGANSYYGYGYGYGYGYSYNYNYSYHYGEQEKKGFMRKLKDFVGF